MKNRLSDKVFLITGSSGIAAATARLAVAEGAAVCVIGNDEISCRALHKEIHCHYFIADLTHAEQVEAAVNGFAAAFDRIDALFNVAGISGRRLGDGPVHECSDQGWEMTLDTNLKSVFLMCRAVTKLLLNQEPDDAGLRGAILNMASALVLSPEPRHFATHAYAASKSAIIGLTETMAAYYAPHKIRVNAIAPALTRTPMSLRAQQDPRILDFIKTKQPLAEGLIEAEDIAQAAIFMMSDRARYITGEVLAIDAGWRMS
ncbi:MAG: SDR family NAD(P)-dependent oxidoreductase [Blastocatellia bacterium]